MQKFIPLIFSTLKSSICRQFVVCLAMLLPMTATAKPADRYTKERPLVIVSDWEFPPYEFRSSNGAPTGFNIDVVNAILDKLKIPHKFVMKEWSHAVQQFEHREADLIVAPLFSSFRTAPYFCSHSILSYYKIKIAAHRDSPLINSAEELLRAKGIVLKNNDITSQRVLANEAPQLAYESHSVKDALSGLKSGSCQYFVWGEEPLKWKLKELNLQDDIVLSDYDISTVEIHFVGYDQELIDLLDDQYARMEQNGDLELISDKWFHPEQVHNDTSPISIIVTLAILAWVISLYLINRLLRNRVIAATKKNKDLENMMLQALHTSDYSVMQYDIQTDRFTNTHGTMLQEGGITLQRMFELMHPSDRDQARKQIQLLMEGKSSIWEIKNQWNAGTDEKPNWRFIYGHAIPERDENNQIRYIVSTVKDTTREFEQERKDWELASKFVKIFDSTLVAMSFYDKNGQLIDLNKNMRKLACFDAEGEKLFCNTSMFDITLLKDDFDPKHPQMLHACQHMHYAEAGIDTYIEFRIRPVFIGDSLEYYLITARDLSAERDMYIEQQQHEKKLQHANEIITQYENELKYLLENSRMWVWRSDLKTRTINFSTSLRETTLVETFEEFRNSLYPEDRERAMAELGNMEGADINFNSTFHYEHALFSEKPIWATISGIPTYDEEGRLTGHFGVVRDVTEFMEAQEKLKRETNRAEDSGKLKSVFLANMTHEIRTPLNAIVGFSDLLQMVEGTDERREFIRIIRNNCDMLIRLINDIIEASNMNQGPLSIEVSDLDWAVAFNDICQSLAQRVQEPGVEFIVDNPYTSFPTRLDKGRLQQVITNFTTNAVKYTHQGHIRVGYSYIDSPEAPGNGQKGIYMYCEDTGEGIPKDKQASVFERFVKLNDYVQGTGLGLAICKNIAERCNGHIGVISEGSKHGSTFWIWIPCDTLRPPTSKQQ